jgi:hypothetical protein
MDGEKSNKEDYFNDLHCLYGLKYREDVLMSIHAQRQTDTTVDEYIIDNEDDNIEDATIENPARLWQPFDNKDDSAEAAVYNAAICASVLKAEMLLSTSNGDGDIEDEEEAANLLYTAHIRE